MPATSSPATTDNGVTIENDGTDTSATGNRVQGNNIGFNTRVGVLYLIPNFADGVSISSSGNQVGGDTSAAMNIIIDNGLHGVAIVAAALGSAPTANLIQGNYIGTSWKRPLRQRARWYLPLGGVGQYDRWHHRIMMVRGTHPTGKNDRAFHAPNSVYLA